MTVSPDRCELTRRGDGAVLVRVRSAVIHGLPLPDAVFAFRVGDPQYEYWDRHLRERQQHRVAS